MSQQQYHHFIPEAQNSYPKTYGWCVRAQKQDFLSFIDLFLPSGDRLQIDTPVIYTVARRETSDKLSDAQTFIFMPQSCGTLGTWGRERDSEGEGGRISKCTHLSSCFQSVSVVLPETSSSSSSWTLICCHVLVHYVENTVILTERRTKSWTQHTASLPFLFVFPISAVLVSVCFALPYSLQLCVYSFSSLTGTHTHTHTLLSNQTRLHLTSVRRLYLLGARRLVSLYVTALG